MVAPVILDLTTKELRIVLGEAQVTHPCQCVSSYAETSSAVWLGQDNEINTNGTTPVVVVAPPSNNTVVRDVREVRVYNADTVTHAITLQLYDGTTAWVVQAESVAVGSSFVYTPGGGSTGPVGSSNPLTIADGNGVSIGTVSTVTFEGPQVSGTSPNATVTLIPQGYINGAQITVASTTSFSVSAGQGVSSDNTTVINLASAITKLTGGTWVAGNNQNGLDTGALANSTWYHVYLIFDPATLTTDVLFSANATTPSLPTGYTKYRRVGSVLTGPSTAPLVTIVQNGDRFDLAAPVVEYNATPGATTAASQTLAGTPLGIVIEAIMSGSIVDPTATNSVLYLSSLAQTDTTPGGTNGAITAEIGSAPGADAEASYAGVRIITNTSQQIRRRVNSTTAALILITNGYIDRRGKL